MYLVIIILPLLGSIISGFFGRKIGVAGAQIITCSCVIITMLLSIIIFFEVGLNNVPVFIHLFRWIDSESLNVSWGFYFDSLTVSMLIPVLIVSCLVHIYSIGYMNHDPHNQRFFSYLSLFTFMMIVLVTANNFLLMFVGWEGVGICSYLLVSFWYTRIAANQSSISAFLTNRVGDCFLTIGMFILLWSFGNIDYYTIFSLAPYINVNIITMVGICLLIGAMAKSSQVGLHIWLPQAMEGPTPVSALIHAATMVTAGVYLLIRTSPLIEYSSTALILCLWLGAITTVFSSLIGLFQQDIKKVIAYSTMSQLGMMIIAIGLSSYNVALFHLINHAFYKGLLFLGAGAVIHAVFDNQDFRKYGGLGMFLPLGYSVMLIASLSLVAFPFMTGFYSKDFILESAYGQFHFSSVIVYFIAVIGAIFTTLYSVKVIYLTFLANPNGPLINYKQVHESDIFMSIPLIILGIYSIFFGYFTKDIFIGIASPFFQDNSLFIHPLHEIMLNTEFAVPILFKLLPLIFTISLVIIVIMLSDLYPKLLIYFKLSNFGYNIFSFYNQRFYIELLYNKYVIEVILKLGGQTTKVLDKGSIELLGPFGLENGLLALSKHIAGLDTGVVTSYALYILVGLIFYILIPYFFLINSSLLLLILFGLLSTLKKNNFFNLKNNLIKNSSIMDYCIAVLKKLINNIKRKSLNFFGFINKKLFNTYIFFICELSIIDEFISNHFKHIKNNWKNNWKSIILLAIVLRIIQLSMVSILDFSIPVTILLKLQFINPFVLTFFLVLVNKNYYTKIYRDYGIYILLNEITSIYRLYFEKFAKLIAILLFIILTLLIIGLCICFYKPSAIIYVFINVFAISTKCYKLYIAMSAYIIFTVSLILDPNLFSKMGLNSTLICHMLPTDSTNYPSSSVPETTSNYSTAETRSKSPRSRSPTRRPLPISRPIFPEARSMLSQSRTPSPSKLISNSIPLSISRSGSLYIPQPNGILEYTDSSGSYMANMYNIPRDIVKHFFEGNPVEIMKDQHGNELYYKSRILWRPYYKGTFSNGNVTVYSKDSSGSFTRYRTLPPNFLPSSFGKFFVQEEGSNINLNFGDGADDSLVKWDPSKEAHASKELFVYDPNLRYHSFIGIKTPNKPILVKPFDFYRPILARPS